MNSPPLRAALERLGGPTDRSRVHTVDHSVDHTVDHTVDLTADVELGTVLAQARTGGPNVVARCLPRLMAALVNGELSPVEGIEVVELGTGDDSSRVVDVLEVFDALWRDVLQRTSDEHPPGVEPDDVLGLLAHSPPPMVRWLHPWLDALDGPAAVHLARAITAGFPAPTWAGRHDERRQVMAWTRTETVINGLALVGATHIAEHDDALMSRVLDILILDEDPADA